MKTIFILTISIVFCTNILHGQEEDIYSTLRRYTVSIGYIDSSSVNPNTKKKEKKFTLVGSGLATYNRLDTNIITSFVSAKHVIKFFEDSKFKSFWIRFSWADSIPTTDYFGIEVPLHLQDGSPTFFYHKNPNVDLGCILLAGANADNVTSNYYKAHHNMIFAYNKILSPDLGDNVLVYGYPGHIENFFGTASFTVCTFKPGIVTWKPKQTKTFLDNILLVESNASFGNSGGPVFSLNNGLKGNGGFNIGVDPSLVGILVGGTIETNEIKANGKTVKDSSSKMPLYVESRSGVSIVIKAELVRELLDQVNQFLLTTK